MPRHIIKPDPNVDLYVEWSSVVDAPTAWGTAEYLKLSPERKERADRTGTSSMQGFDDWEDGSIIVSEMGHCSGQYLLPRKDLLAFINELPEAAEDRDAQQVILEKYATKIVYDD